MHLLIVWNPWDDHPFCTRSRTSDAVFNETYLLRQEVSFPQRNCCSALSSQQSIAFLNKVHCFVLPSSSRNNPIVCPQSHCKRACSFQTQVYMALEPLMDPSLIFWWIPSASNRVPSTQTVGTTQQIQQDYTPHSPRHQNDKAHEVLTLTTQRRRGAPSSYHRQSNSPYSSRGFSSDGPLTLHYPFTNRESHQWTQVPNSPPSKCSPPIFHSRGPNQPRDLGPSPHLLPAHDHRSRCCARVRYASFHR